MHFMVHSKIINCWGSGTFCAQKAPNGMDMILSIVFRQPEEIQCANAQFFEISLNQAMAEKIESEVEDGKLLFRLKYSDIE